MTSNRIIKIRHFYFLLKKLDKFNWWLSHKFKIMLYESVVYSIMGQCML